nr:immunoglobulin light chain junction region [Macaca mulatta]
CQQYNSLPFAF